MRMLILVFVFNDTATTEIYTLSLHDALPISKEILRMRVQLDELLAHHTGQESEKIHKDTERDFVMSAEEAREYGRSEEHTSELQSRQYLVCRLLLEKKKT